jgi:cell division GTPase FtsZ
MKVGVIGIGQAGGKIADLLTYHSMWGRHQGIAPFSLAVGSAQADLLGLITIEHKDRILIGQVTSKGHGAGLDRKAGARAITQGLHSIMHALTQKGLPQIGAFIVIAGLGGGTGSGGAPVVISRLRQVYEEPTYLIGVLPSEDEGKLMAMNAIECLQEVEGLANGILVFDNEVWRMHGRPLAASYGLMNHELVKPLPLLLGAGEARKDKVGIRVVDSSDIISTWQGFAYIGYSEMKVRTALDRLQFYRRKTSIDQLSPAMRCYTAIRNAATLRLSGECDIGRANRALMIIAGPPDELNMEGFSQAKTWLERSAATPEVRWGDCPIPRWDCVAAAVMLAGYTEIPRLGVVHRR